MATEKVSTVKILTNRFKEKYEGQKGQNQEKVLPTYSSNNNNKIKQEVYNEHDDQELLISYQRRRTW